MRLCVSTSPVASSDDRATLGSHISMQYASVDENKSEDINVNTSHVAEVRISTRQSVLLMQDASVDENKSEDTTINTSQCDYSLFTLCKDDVFLVLLVYVDDIVLTGNSKQDIVFVKSALSDKFKIKDLGVLKYFLCIEVINTNDGICLSQRKYCLELLNEFGLLSSTHVSSLIEANVNSYKASDGESILSNICVNQSLVGKLIDVTVTRLNISFGVHVLSQYMHSPTVSHLKLAFRVLRYLKDSQGKGILFSKVSKSSAEVEYRATAYVACKLLWLINLHAELKVDSLLPVNMYRDNVPAMQIAVNPVHHERSKHFEIDWHIV
ncbi:uncharacterized mitochondrial protein AtMg00810-like [Rutidosis leptorrhynchoides]|uniref:uncharacterized mitochondrial protein AtMg00810-like n=1 Tax=Rutidosis leptorrhynchoides TaxID=125765 RepID=UPI003A9A5E0E